MARQAALLLLVVNGYEIPSYAVNNDFYRQALELRVPRGEGEAIYSAMGGVDKRRFSQHKDLLKLCDEAMELADRHQLDERTLRHVISLPCEEQFEMIQQIIQFDLTSRQVETILAQGQTAEVDSPDDDIPAFMLRFVRSFIRDADKFNPDMLWNAIYREQGDSHMTSAYLQRLAQVALAAAEKYSEER